MSNAQIIIDAVVAIKMAPCPALMALCPASAPARRAYKALTI